MPGLTAATAGYAANEAATVLRAIVQLTYTKADKEPAAKQVAKGFFHSLFDAIFPVSHFEVLASGAKNVGGRGPSHGAGPGAAVEVEAQGTITVSQFFDGLRSLENKAVLKQRVINWDKQTIRVYVLYTFRTIFDDYPKLITKAVSASQSKALHDIKVKLTEVGGTLCQLADYASEKAAEYKTAFQSL